MFQRQWRQAQRPPRNRVAKTATGKRVVAKKKPAWDSTVSDLTVHQLSREELDLRRSRMLSKNADRAKRELDEIVKGLHTGKQAGGRQLGSGSGGSSSSSIVSKTSGKPENKLHSILEESDRAVSDVRDLFCDDPKRYSGQPNVTVAPRITTDRATLQRTLLESRPDGPTPSALYSPGGIRDESVLGLAPVKPALNDIPSPSSEFTLDESKFEMSSLGSSPPGSSYRPGVDLSRFQRLVEGGGEVGRECEGEGSEVTERTELSSIVHTGSQGGGTHATVDSTEVGEGRDATTSTAQPKTVAPLQQQHPLQIVHKMPGLKSDRSTGSTSANSAGTLQQPTHSGSSSSFSRNQRLRKLPPGRPVAAGASNSDIYDDLTVLQKLVENLERELQEYEKSSGYCFPVKKPVAGQSGTFTSLTVSLLASVTKLTHYLKQSEIQLKGEVAVRNQLLHAMAEQQNLMDALTADVVKLQEENSSLKSGLQKLELSNTQQTKTLQEDILELQNKVCALEQAKPLPDKETSSAASVGEELPASTTVLPAVHYQPQAVESSARLAPPSPRAVSSSLPLLLQANQLLYSGITPLNTAANSQGPLFNSTPLTGLTPTPMTSTKPLPPPLAIYNHPHSWPLAATQPDTEPSPAHLPYQTPSTVAPEQLKPSLVTPFSVTPSLSVSGKSQGLSIMSMSPSDVGVPSLPTSVALQLPSQPPAQPFGLAFQQVPLSPHSPTPNPALSLLASKNQPPVASLSLPYSWEAPVNTSASPSVGKITMDTIPSTKYSSASATPTNPPSSAYALPKETLPESQKGMFVPSVTLPDLSFSPASPPVPDTSSEPRDASPSQSGSSVDIEASLARMSSLARSVLQELAQERGHIQSTTHPSLPPVHTPSTPVVESKRSSMTAVTSLDDSAASELTPSIESMTVQD